MSGNIDRRVPLAPAVQQRSEPSQSSSNNADDNNQPPPPPPPGPSAQQPALLEQSTNVDPDQPPHSLPTQSAQQPEQAQQQDLLPLDVILQLSDEDLMEALDFGGYSDDFAFIDATPVEIRGSLQQVRQQNAMGMFEPRPSVFRPRDVAVRAVALANFSIEPLHARELRLMGLYRWSFARPLVLWEATRRLRQRDRLLNPDDDHGNSPPRSSSPSPPPPDVDAVTYPQQVNWIVTDMHTAICDVCGNRNKDTLYRCIECGHHRCTPCKEKMSDEHECGRPLESLIADIRSRIQECLRRENLNQQQQLASSSFGAPQPPPPQQQPLPTASSTSFHHYHHQPQSSPSLTPTARGPYSSSSPSFGPVRRGRVIRNTTRRAYTLAFSSPTPVGGENTTAVSPAGNSGTGTGARQGPVGLNTASTTSPSESRLLHLHDTPTNTSSIGSRGGESCANDNNSNNNNNNNPTSRDGQGRGRARVRRRPVHVGGVQPYPILPRRPPIDGDISNVIFRRTPSREDVGRGSSVDSEATEIVDFEALGLFGRRRDNDNNNNSNNNNDHQDSSVNDPTTTRSGRRPADNTTATANTSRGNDTAKSSSNSRATRSYAKSTTRGKQAARDSDSSDSEDEYGQRKRPRHHYDVEEGEGEGEGEGEEKEKESDRDTLSEPPSEAEQRQHLGDLLGGSDQHMDEAAFILMSIRHDREDAGPAAVAGSGRRAVVRGARDVVGDEGDDEAPSNKRPRLFY